MVSSNNVDYTALLAEAKAMNAKVQEARHNACMSSAANPKQQEKAYNIFNKLDKEYTQWKKANIDKRGLVLRTIGDCDEPIAILMVLAGSYNVPVKLKNGCYVVEWVFHKHN